MILAAGFGKRLNPLTLNIPKPLLKIGGETLLSNTINFLENYGTEEAVINVHYFSDQIIEYVNKKKFNLKITIVNEKEKILDTGGGILNALKYFKESFVCINPDTIWTIKHSIEIIKMLPKRRNSLFETVITSANDELVNLFLQHKISLRQAVDNLAKIIKLKEYKKYFSKKPTSLNEIRKVGKLVRLKTNCISV